MEPGTGSPEPGRAARAEVGPAWRREAHGGLPPRAAHAPGAVTSPAWGLGVAGPAPSSSPPRPALAGVWPGSAAEARGGQ